MSWLTTTYDEIVARLKTAVPTLKSTDLFNNQFDDLKDGGTNEEYPWQFPCCFVAFGGGSWERQADNNRISRDYEIRLHIGSHTYNEGRGHLDTIPAYANALDGWTGTYCKLDFIQDIVDDSRTNVIEHILVFRATVVDCSPTETDPPVTQVATDLEINATVRVLEGRAWVTVDGGSSWWTVDGQVMETIE